MTLLNPLNVVRSALQTAIQLANKLVQRGISGIRKRFSRKSFIPVQFIKLEDLKIDSKYQRLINTNFIKNAKEFRPTLVKPLSVFLRPDTVWLQTHLLKEQIKVLVDLRLTLTVTIRELQFKTLCKILLHNIKRSFGVSFFMLLYKSTVSQNLLILG